jgi:hypothetical protein
VDAGLGDLPEDGVAELIKDDLGHSLGHLADDAPKVPGMLFSLQLERPAARAWRKSASYGSRPSSRQLSMVAGSSEKVVAARNAARSGTSSTLPSFQARPLLSRTRSSDAKTRPRAPQSPYGPQTTGTKEQLMRTGAAGIPDAQTSAGANAPQKSDAGAGEGLKAAIDLRAALARRGIEIDSLSAAELSELEALITKRMAPLLDEIAAGWREDHGRVSETERLERELRRRIVAEKVRMDSAYECEGCSFRHDDGDVFCEFHGLFLCDGCYEFAREELRALRRPLVEALAAEPTVAKARALGFELTRRSDGRLVWVSEDEDFDGGVEPYADEQEALACLAEELA